VKPVPAAWLRRVLPLALVLAPATGRAQGGPPLVTDDPGTPGNRRWEINVAFTFERRGTARTFETPLVDANYGLGDRIQLKIEMPWIVRREDAGPRQDGAGNALFGVKWRFLDEATRGVAVAVYPQIEVNTSAYSARRGLAEKEPGLLLPLSLQKAVGPLSANVEIGHAFRRGQKPVWVYGLALGRELSEKLEVMAEIFGRASSRWTGIGSGWNLGLRWKLGKRCVLLASAGAGIAGSEGEPRASFQGYSALQLVF